MPIFLSEAESTKLGNKQVLLDKNIVDDLEKRKNFYSGNATQSKGYKRLMSLTDKDYNKRSSKKDAQHNGRKTISFSDLKKIDYEMKHMNQSPDNIEYELIGGDKMRDWVKQKLETMRSSVREVGKVVPVSKPKKHPMKPQEPVKNVKVNNKDITIRENLIMSNNDFSNLILK